MSSDEELMRRYTDRGDRPAFEELFRRYAPRLARYFARTTDADPQDLTQQTLLHLHRARADFRHDAALRPWLFAIAANVRREHWRRRARKPEAPLEDAREPSVSAGVSSATDRAVSRCVQALPDGQREVVVLHWYEELSFVDIAHIVGASHSAVKVRAHRAYAALRTCLGL